MGFRRRINFRKYHSHQQSPRELKTRQRHYMSVSLSIGVQTLYRNPYFFAL